MKPRKDPIRNIHAETNKILDILEKLQQNVQSKLYEDPTLWLQGAVQGVKVKIPADLSLSGKSYWKYAKIDAAIADVVEALQCHNIAMRGSCSGHLKREGYIRLQDGRVLLVLPPKTGKEYIARRGQFNLNDYIMNEGLPDKVTTEIFALGDTVPYAAGTQEESAYRQALLDAIDAIKEDRPAHKETIDNDLARRALRVIEGLTFSDIANDPQDKIEEIYKYAHIALGDCKNQHDDWNDELLAAEKELIKMGIISEEK